jgi:hypothetical protein
MAHSPDDISGFSTLTGDDNTASVTLPFTFTVEGTNYTTLVLSTNGWLEFGSNTSGGANVTNTCLPTANHTNPFLAAYWDDLVPLRHERPLRHGRHQREPDLHRRLRGRPVQRRARGRHPLPGPAPRALELADPPIAETGQCCEMFFPGPPPAPSCAFVGGGGTLRCK